ncbi:MAG: hypothetical protein M1826_003608 [Phylliscum demangeonii]|nr:MAG: hypothetical protein M1826_003608 [Phylliscum demangeonii]
MWSLVSKTDYLPMVRFLQQALASGVGSDAMDAEKNEPSAMVRPGLSLTVLAMGLLFTLQNQLLQLLWWHTPTHTLSFLAVYTFVCLNPSLVLILPFGTILVMVMVPAFLVRHPPPPTRLSADSCFTRGPPTAPPAELKPAPEISKDFFRNLRDLQNLMDDCSRVHDQVAAVVGPPTNFSDERFSSATFLFLFLFAALTFLTSQFFPWRSVMLSGGWAMISLGHPVLQRILLSTHRAHLKPWELQAKDWVMRFMERDITLDMEPEVREVEIFELQRRSPTKEWESWTFTPSPYDLLSPERVSNIRPPGTRLLEDVQAPSGWRWTDHKWQLDIHSQDWVEERLIAAVKVETEGERWVYDMPYHEPLDELDSVSNLRATRQRSEGEQVGAPDENEWRRRRWIRHVKKRVVKAKA